MVNHNTNIFRYNMPHSSQCCFLFSTIILFDSLKSDTFYNSSSNLNGHLQLVVCCYTLIGAIGTRQQEIFHRLTAEMEYAAGKVLQCLEKHHSLG